jgi:hypothetical protein
VNLTLVSMIVCGVIIAAVIAWAVRALARKPERN